MVRGGMPRRERHARNRPLISDPARLSREEGLMVLEVEQNVGSFPNILDPVFAKMAGRIVSPEPPAAYARHGDVARYSWGSQAVDRRAAVGGAL